MKKMILARHGLCVQKPLSEGGGSYDKLKQESVKYMYEKIGIPLQLWVKENDVSLDSTLLRHYCDRTKYTGLSIITGAFNLQPKEGNCPPQKQEDLDKYDFFPIEMTHDPELIYGALNMAKSNNGDYTANINFWLANRKATEHDGVIIDSYTESVLPRARRVIKRSLSPLVYDNKKMVVVVSSSGFLEAIADELIGGITSLDDIGGKGFEMQETAEVNIYDNNKTIFSLRGQDYPVNLDKLLGGSYDF